MSSGTSTDRTYVPQTTSGCYWRVWEAKTPGSTKMGQCRQWWQCHHLMQWTLGAAGVLMVRKPLSTNYLSRYHWPHSDYVSLDKRILLARVRFRIFRTYPYTNLQPSLSWSWWPTVTALLKVDFGFKAGYPTFTRLLLKRRLYSTLSRVNPTSTRLHLGDRPL